MLTHVYMIYTLQTCIYIETGGVRQYAESGDCTIQWLQHHMHRVSDSLVSWVTMATASHT